MFLGNISQDFTIDNTKKTTIIWEKIMIKKRSVKSFSVDYRSINTNETLNIHVHLMKELLLYNVWNYLKNVYCIIG